MTPESFRLDGKTAVVTGANTGLGQGIAVALAKAGARIALVGRSPPDDTVRELEKLGSEFLTLKADLSNLEQIDAIIEKTQTEIGTPGILVNNAGTIKRNDAIDFTAHEWDSVMGVNLRTVFFLSQGFAKRCISSNQPGKIINIASMLSFQGGIRVPSYTASKSGLMGLTRALANEWAAKQINVNAIAPGYFATNNTAALQADETRNRQILERIPAGRWGKPSDLAGAAIFLASSASDYVHGTTIPVDGGWLSR